MKLADYSDRVTADQLDTALRQGGFEGVFHYLSGNNALRIEDPAVVAAMHQRGWPQAGIDVPTLSGIDGSSAASRVRNVYGVGDGFRIYLDIEPGEFDAAPASWSALADFWCDGIRAAGLSPGIYGVDRTVAACANRADTIWRAVPGMCDPAAAGPQGLNPAFMPGRRAVQCGQETHNGVTFDVSYSQFELGVKRMTRDGWAGICGGFIVTFVSDPPGSKPGATDPNGGPYYWDYYWADQILSLGERAGWRAFLDWLKTSATVQPIPLTPASSVGEHTHRPGSASTILTNSGGVVRGA